MTVERKRFRYFGSEDELSSVTHAIMDEDIGALEAMRGEDWELNKKFETLVNKPFRNEALAIELALVERKYKVLDYLLSLNADLNVPDAPAITSAVHTLDTAIIDRLLDAGAKIDARNNVQYDALDQCIAWEYFELIPYLESKGLTFDAHKGSGVVSAIGRNQIEFVRYALERGWKPNYNSSMSQGGLGEAPLHRAALSSSLEMVELLISSGADPARENFLGQRPYFYALASGREPIAAYLRSVEPPELHDTERQRQLARRFNVPADLMARVSSPDLALGRARDGEPIVQLLALEDMYVLRWAGRWGWRKFLALAERVHDGYNAGEIVWCRRRRRVCVLDVEHNRLAVAGKWDTFVADPAKLVDPW